MLTKTIISGKYLGSYLIVSCEVFNQDEQNQLDLKKEWMNLNKGIINMEVWGQKVVLEKLFHVKVR